MPDTIATPRPLPRLALIISVIAGVSYLAAGQIALPFGAAVAWKGAGVGLLALYAAMIARDADGWLITGVMAAGAVGDMLLDAISLEAGAIAFVIGHAVAIWLYAKHLRPQPTLSQRLLGIGIVPLALIICTAMLPGQSGVAIYTLIVATMAGSAWLSRFPRYRVGIGAMMFLASDLLIFARMGPLAAHGWVGYAVWGLYYAGQFLIVTGVSASLPMRKAAS